MLICAAATDGICLHVEEEFVLMLQAVTFFCFIFLSNTKDAMFFFFFKNTYVGKFHYMLCVVRVPLCCGCKI